MDIIIIGTGYVGLVTGACFAEMGNNVTCVDIDEKKILMLKEGKIPIYEPGLDVMVSKNIKNNNLHFTTDLSEVIKQKANICFIAVGTPMNEDGSADLHYVLKVAEEIGKYMNKHMYIVNKSTVPVGTADKVNSIIQNNLDSRNSKLTFDMVSNPEFLKEGSSINDFMKPDRVIIGVDNQHSENIMNKLYSPFMTNHNRLISMDIKSAEMTKYVSNSMLATKISFINEMANICEMVGANINDVRRGIGSDSRIGYHFIYPGCGYGGSCFPKDVRALIKTAECNNYETKLLNAVEQVNNKQKNILVEKIIKRFGKNLINKCFGIWGLAFKPETDDMREASSIVLIKRIIELGGKIKVYDPQAMEVAKQFYFQDLYNSIKYCNDKYSAIKGVDALILVTEWHEFRGVDFAFIKSQLKKPIIFDGRNQYDSKNLTEQNFEYYQIGVKSFNQ